MFAGGGVILCLGSIFLKLHRRFNFIIQSYGLCSVLHTLSIGFNAQYGCFSFPLLLRPTNYFDVHLLTQKLIFLLLLRTKKGKKAFWMKIAHTFYSQSFGFF